MDYTSSSLSEDDWCGSDFVDTCLFAELVETAELLEARFLSLLTAFLKTISTICMLVSSLDMRSAEVH